MPAPDDAHALHPYDAVLVQSFGGPEGPDEVLPFLRRVTAGRGVPDERLAKMAADGSPNAFTAIYERYHQEIWSFHLVGDEFRFTLVHKGRESGAESSRWMRRVRPLGRTSLRTPAVHVEGAVDMPEDSGDNGVNGKR